MINVNIIPSYYTISYDSTEQSVGIFLYLHFSIHSWRFLLFAKHLFAFIYRSHIFPNFILVYNCVRIDMTKIFYRRACYEIRQFCFRSSFIKLSISIKFYLHSSLNCLLIRACSYQSNKFRLIREIYLFHYNNQIPVCFFRNGSERHSHVVGNLCIILSAHTTEGKKIFPSVCCSKITTVITVTNIIKK